MVILNDELVFPDPEEADADGLLAAGGDLEPERLMAAYQSGIFPWFSDAGIIFWYSPPERFVLFPSSIKISHSMKKIMRSGKFLFTENGAFEQVIQNCSSHHSRSKGATWISDDFIEAYIRLHKLNHAHSFEAWHQQQLAGGLYGVQIGKIFCGESMFSSISNASKATMISLCTSNKYELIDCQVYSPHLESLGGQRIPRKEFINLLSTLGPI